MLKIKKKIIFLGFIVIFARCIFSCMDEAEYIKKVGYREAMRKFIIKISESAKASNADFLIIPQNGIELVCNDDKNRSSLNSDYLSAIDGNGQESLFYGYSGDDQATPDKTIEYLKSFLNQSKESGNIVLVIDYCFSSSNIYDSRLKNTNLGYISFAATERLLNNIPDSGIQHENNLNVKNFDQVKNFLCLINSENYKTKEAFIHAVIATNYDLLIMDLFDQDGVAYTAEEVSRLKQKANGGKRLVCCYMSIGEAEDYRYYWQSKWKLARPKWLNRENTNWKGNYKVNYWMKDWQDIILGTENSYLSLILSSDFDGVYLDIVDAFEFFE